MSVSQTSAQDQTEQGTAEQGSSIADSSHYWPLYQKIPEIFILGIMLGAACGSFVQTFFYKDELLMWICLLAGAALGLFACLAIAMKYVGFLRGQVAADEEIRRAGDALMRSMGG